MFIIIIFSLLLWCLVHQIFHPRSLSRKYCSFCCWTTCNVAAHANYVLSFIIPAILFKNNNLFNTKITGRLQLYSKLISSGSGCSLSLSWASLWALCGLRAAQRGALPTLLGRRKDGETKEKQWRRDEQWEKRRQSRDLDICPHQGLVHCCLHASRR